MGFSDFNDKTFKQMQDEKFDWFKPRNKNAHNKSAKDVSIHFITTSKRDNTKGFSLVFRNGCWENLGEKVELAIYKNRLFFRACEDDGLSIRPKKSANNNHRYAQISSINEQTERLKDFCGDFDLKHDDFYELYYVEKE